MINISVVIPTYKRIARLKKAIQSVLGQATDDIEVIVVNDSLDEVDCSQLKDMVLGFNDDRIILINNFRMKGGCGARNSGIITAKGKYIAFLDDDDYLYPDALKYQLEAFKEDIGMVVGACKIIDEIFESQKLVVKGSKELKFNDIIMGECPASTSLVMVRKQIIIESGLFDEYLPSFQDYDMWLRIAKRSKIQQHIHLVSAFVTHVGDRTSININKRLNGLDLVINKWTNEIENIRSIKEFRSYYVAEAFFKSGILMMGLGIRQRHKAMKSFLKAISLQIANVHYWKWFIFSLLGFAVTKRLRKINASD